MSRKKLVSSSTRRKSASSAASSATSVATVLVRGKRGGSTKKKKRGTKRGRDSDSSSSDASESDTESEKSEEEVNSDEESSTASTSSSSASSSGHEGSINGRQSNQVNPGSEEDSSEVKEDTIDEIVVRVDALLKPFPLAHPYHKMHERLKKQYENIKNNIINVVFCAKRGEGKSETANYCAMSFSELAAEGFAELYGSVPLESALRGTSVTSIPAWIEYSEHQPECLAKLSDGQEVDIYDIANEDWKNSNEARNPRIAQASPYVRTSLVFRYANMHAKALTKRKTASDIKGALPLAASSSAIASSSAAASSEGLQEPYILHLTLKWKWEFGNRFRFGDTLGWEDAATNDLNAPLMNEANVFVSMTSRAMSHDELKSFIQHGAFCKNSDTQRRSTSLLSFYRTSEPVGDEVETPPTNTDPLNTEGPLDANQLFQRALAQTLQDPVMTNMTRDWQERCDLFQSLQRNAVLCGFDRHDPGTTSKLVHQALLKVQEKFLQQKLIDFIKATSSVVFCVNRKLNNHPTGKSSRVYTTAELLKRSAQKPSPEREIKKKLSESVFDADFDPHDFGSFPMPNSQAETDFQARKDAIFAAGNLFTPMIAGSPATSSSVIVSSHASSSFTEQEVLYRVNQFHTLLMDVLVQIKNDYCIHLLHSLVNRVEEKKKQSQEDADAMEIDAEDYGAAAASASLSPKAAKVNSRKNISSCRTSTPKKKVKVEHGSIDAEASSSSSLVASRSQRQISGDSTIDSPESVMSMLLNSIEIQKPIADLFESLRASIRLPELYDIITNAVMLAQNEVITKFEVGALGVDSMGDDLTPDAQEVQFESTLLARAIEETYKCVHQRYVADWIKQFEQAAVTAWSRLKRDFEAVESDPTNIQVGTQVLTEAKQLCQDLKRLSNQHLERTKQKQKLVELSRGGTFSDAIRVNGLPRAHRVYDSLEKLVRTRKSPPTEAEITNAESNEFHTKCPSWQVKKKRDESLQGIKVDLLTSERISIRASFGQQISDLIEMYRKSVSDIHFGTEHHGKTDPKSRMLFPVYTPLFLTCEADAQAMVRHLDYNGMKHLSFVSVERGQQQKWLEEAMLDQVNESSSIILVSIASADATIHLDVLRSLLTAFGFQYAWRRTMNFKNMNELQPILFSTFPCETSFAMISMQQMMKDVYHHTVIKFARGFSSALVSKARRLIFTTGEIEDEKQDQLSTIMDNLMKAVANSDNSKQSAASASSAASTSSIKAQSSSMLDGAATITEIELRELATALRAVNSKAESVFTPLLDILQPYFLCGMVTALPRMFMLHEYLPIYPDLHRAHASSTRMHSLVLEHLPALSHVPFNTPKDAKSAAERYQLAHSMLPPTSSYQQLKEKKSEFELLTLRAEQRCKNRITDKKLCVPHILCASFGLGLTKYTAFQKAKETKNKVPNVATSEAAVSSRSMVAAGKTNRSSKINVKKE